MVLAGCTTKPVETSVAKNVPGGRVFNKEIMESADNKGTVIVKRDSGHVGNACYSILYLDGKQIAYLDSAEKLIFYVPSGDHLIGAEPKGLCSGSLSEQKIMVGAGKTQTYRVGYDSGVIYGLRPTAF